MMAAAIVASSSAGSGLLADELYNLDFSPPETGSCRTIFGSPTVVESVGDMTNALLFHAVTTYDQISLTVGTSAPRYEIAFDVLAHNLRDSDYTFTAFLDTSSVRALSLHGGLDTFLVYQPGFESSCGEFLDERVYHIGIVVDFPSNLWTVAVDGIQRSSRQMNDSVVRAIRFSMAPWKLGVIDDPDTFAAIDNIVVVAVPEPGILLLLPLGLAAMLVFARGWRQLSPGPR